MDREVINSTFAMLEAAGCRPPANYHTADGREQAVLLWCDLLHDCDPTHLRRAVASYLRGPDSQYWPTPGLLLKLTHPIASNSTSESQPAQTHRLETPPVREARLPQQPAPEPRIPPVRTTASRPPTSSRSLFGGKRSRPPSKAFSFPPQASPVAAEPALPPSMMRAPSKPSLDSQNQTEHSPNDSVDLPPVEQTEVNESSLESTASVSANSERDSAYDLPIDFSEYPELESKLEELDSIPTDIDEQTDPTVTVNESAEQNLQLHEDSEPSVTSEEPTEQAPLPEAAAQHSLEEEILAPEPSSTQPVHEYHENLTTPTLAPEDLETLRSEILATDEIPSMVTIGEMGSSTQSVSQLDNFGNREITEWDEDEFDRELTEMQRLRAASNKTRMRLMGAIGLTVIAVLVFVAILFSSRSNEILDEQPRKTARALKEEAQAKAIELASTAPDLSGDIKAATTPGPNQENVTESTPQKSSPKVSENQAKASTPSNVKPKPPAKEQPAPAPTAVATPAPTTVDVATPSPAPITKPAPAPVAAPPPNPSPVTPPSSASLVDKGWDNVESNPTLAAKYFKQAIDRDSADHDANLGYGYVLMKQGNLDDAGRYLCRARRSPSVETQREARQFLLNNGLTCN